MAKIVVVDDEPHICNAIEELLVKEGHEVRVSSVGDEAIDLGYLFQPDLLITDWKLKSEYDGLEVAEAVSAAKSNIKTILISGYAYDEEPNNVEIFAMLPKPFTVQQLSATVEQALLSS